MELLADRGRHSLTVGRLEQALRPGGPPLPDRPVVITFDDGFADFHSTALPVLEKHHLASTMYATTGYLGGTARWLAREREQDRRCSTPNSCTTSPTRGVEIGAHSHTHPRLDELSAADSRPRSTAARRSSSRSLQRPVTSFAYPHGCHSRRVREQVIEAGYSSATAVRHAMSSPEDDLFALARVMVLADTTPRTWPSCSPVEGIPQAPTDRGRGRPVACCAAHTAGAGPGAQGTPGGMMRPSGAAGAQTTRVRPAPRRTWRELVAVDPDALPTQSPEWLDSLCADGRYVDASRCYELPDGRRALLPLVRRAHRTDRASTLASMPASWGFGGLLVEGGVTVEAVSAVVDDLVGQTALRVRLRPNPLHADVWAAAMAERRGVSTTPSCAHVLDLDGGFDTVWQQRFKATTRNQVRKAERMGVVVETDTTGRLLPELHALLRTSVDRWASRQHEPARWHSSGSRVGTPRPSCGRSPSTWAGPAGCRLPRFDGVAVAAILVLQGRNAHYTRGAMDEELASRTHANKLLHTVAIEAACEAGSGTLPHGRVRGVGRTLAVQEPVRRGGAPLPRVRHRTGASHPARPAGAIQRQALPRVPRCLTGGAGRSLPPPWR